MLANKQDTSSFSVFSTFLSKASFDYKEDVVIA